jgi:hypothetical protein
MGVNISAVRQQITLVKQATTSPEAFAKLHAQVAREARAEVEARQGRYPTMTVVDGRQGAAEEQVKPFGVIEYHFNPAGDVIDATYQALLERAPVKTGRYRDNIWMFVNGVRRDADAEGQLVQIAAGDEVVFIDTVPYARKIEGGFKSVAKQTSRPGLSAQAPNGVFEITAKEMKRRFGNYPVDIAFEYRAVLDGSAVSAGPAKASIRGAGGRFKANGGTQRANQSQNRWPAIMIRVH